MRRITLIVGIGALAVGVFATLALASIKHFQGHVDQGGKITFDAKVKDGKPKKAGAFKVGPVRVSCDEGNTPLSARMDDFVRVRHRKFHTAIIGGIAGVGGRVSISGKFNRKGNKAHGEFKAVNVDFGGRLNCTTNGPRDWTAEK